MDQAQFGLNLNPHRTGLDKGLFNLGSKLNNPRQARPNYKLGFDNSSPVPTRPLIVLQGTNKLNLFPSTRVEDVKKKKKVRAGYCFIYLPFFKNFERNSPFFKTIFVVMVMGFN